MLLGVAEAMREPVLSEQQRQHGIDVATRDKLLRTFVANNYHYHLQVNQNVYDYHHHLAVEFGLTMNTTICRWSSG